MPAVSTADVKRKLRRALRIAQAAKQRAGKGIGKAEDAQVSADAALARAEAAQGSADSALLRRTTYFAKVDADATETTLLRGDATAAERQSQGVFAVTFPVDVGDCGWTATRQDNSDGVTAPGEIAIEQSSGATPNILWVRTYDSAGVAQDPSTSDGFTVAIFC